MSKLDKIISSLDYVLIVSGGFLAGVDYQMRDFFGTAIWIIITILWITNHILNTKGE